MNAPKLAVADAPRSTATPPDELAGYHDLAESLVAPLRADVVDREGLNGPHRDLRAALDELLYDCQQGLTAHAASERAEDIGDGVADWLRSRSAEGGATPKAEMARVISRLGTALKAIRGEDQSFFSNMDGHLGQMRGATSGPRSARTSMQRLNQMIDQLAGEVQAQRERSDRRVRQLSGLVREMHSELSEVKIKLAEDPLTGLANRGSFDQRLRAMLSQAQLSPYSFTLILVDLDKFKSVNDTHGHVAGDRVLKSVAQVMGKLVMGSEDLVARYGGEELAILLDDSRAPRGQRVAEEIRETLEKTVVPMRGCQHIQTASFGVAEGCDSDTPESLIQRADECLYLAKENGRNRVVIAGQGPLGRRVAIPDGLRARR